MKKSLYVPVQEITPLTMAVLPQHDDNGYLGSLILEDKEEFVVSYSPSKMIDYACQFFGASLSGRQKGTKIVSQMTHKVPVSIDAHSGMYFFPTMSPVNPKCAWIGHTHIESVNKVENHKSEIVFRNGQRVVLDVSFGSIMNQINRTAQYRYTLDSRLENIQSLKRMIDIQKPKL